MLGMGRSNERFSNRSERVSMGSMKIGVPW
jgi:hypothetical protein